MYNTFEDEILNFSKNCENLPLNSNFISQFSVLIKVVFKNDSTRISILYITNYVLLELENLFKPKSLQL